MKISVIQNDITQVKVDVIVNAANSSLLGGGGVDGAIHRKGGAEILDECRAIRAKQGKCKVGQAVMTNAGFLLAKKVIHTVGPFYHEGSSTINGQLRQCYQNSLSLANKEGLETIAFPNISTGIYKFPKKLAADIAIQAVKESEYLNDFKEVIFVCLDNDNYMIYSDIMIP